MSIIGTATSGMSAALQRFDVSATAIARQETADGNKVDLAKEVAEIITAKAEVQANAAVARTGSKTIGALVDILA
jgi:flagellar hook protein FlgE